MSTSGISGNSLSPSFTQPTSSLEETIIADIRLDTATPSIADDSVEIGGDFVTNSISVLAQKVLDKLNELFGKDIPGGIYNLKPEDHTPEKTAQRIVDGVTGLFAAFAKQNGDLEGEELLTAFMDTIRGGIQDGYGQAEAILGDVGAFDVAGVREGIDETKRLVEEKLKAFEENYRKQLRGEPTASAAASTSASELVANGAATTVSATA